jgi:transposase
MYIRRTTKQGKSRSYHNYLLVESVKTAKGPRQRVLCSLGDLSARSESEWLRLVGRVEDALAGQGQLLCLPDDQQAAALVRRVHARQQAAASAAAPALPLAEVAPPVAAAAGEVIGVRVEQVRTEHVREAGPLHVANCFWHRLGLSEILTAAGLGEPAVRLAQAMVANRLIAPCSEHAMVDWFDQVALDDVLNLAPATLNDDQLYRELDRLHPLRERIETALAQREERLYHLERSVLLYDLTSTYCEGLAAGNPQARRGYSRDQRPDCKQVVVGLALRPEGFPVGHEIFAGSQQDGPSLPLMIAALKRRFGLHQGDTVVVDRGMASAPCLAALRAEQLHYLVATRQSERLRFLAEFEDLAAFTPVRRNVSPTNAYQHKSHVQVRALERDGELWVLCLSEGRQAKDRAIRDKHQTRLLADLAALQKSAAAGRLTVAQVYERLGRLRERYPRVGRYVQTIVSGDDRSCRMDYQLDPAQQALAAQLDGAYLMRTDRLDLTAEEAWQTYILLTRVETAFRDLKTPLHMRPIHHQLEHRVQAHIFLSILAYHLLIAIENTLREHGDHRSWATIRDALRTHQTLTTILPTSNGHELHLRNGSVPEPAHRTIYAALDIPAQIMRPQRTWVAPNRSSDESAHPPPQTTRKARKSG